MINAAIFGLGRWGQALVTAVQGKSERVALRNPLAPSGFFREQIQNRHVLLTVFRQTLAVGQRVYLGLVSELVD